MMTYNEVMARVQAQQQCDTTYRTLRPSDMERLAAMLPRAKRVARVYSGAGFVARSYRWKCRIQWCEARRMDDGWMYVLGEGAAQRAYGNGALSTVDGRSA